jgi:hypothetical protein
MCAKFFVEKYFSGSADLKGSVAGTQHATQGGADHVHVHVGVGVVEEVLVVGVRIVLQAMMICMEHCICWWY